MTIFDQKHYPTEDDNRMFFRALKSGSYDTIAEFVEKFPAAIDRPDTAGRTPLILASTRYDVVKLLLEKKASPHKKDCGGRTALSWASYYGCEEIVSLLLDHGADPNAKDNKGRASLAWAAVSGKKGTAEILLRKGADIDAKDDQGHTPAEAAGERCAAVAELIHQWVKDADYSRGLEEDTPTPKRIKISGFKS